MPCITDKPIVEAISISVSKHEAVMLIFMMVMLIALMAVIFMMKKTQDTLAWVMDKTDKASTKLQFVESRHMKAHYRGHELIRI